MRLDIIRRFWGAAGGKASISVRKSSRWGIWAAEELELVDLTKIK